MIAVFDYCDVCRTKPLRFVCTCGVGVCDGCSDRCDCDDQDRRERARDAVDALEAFVALCERGAS